jgi:PqqD family protein of HPr-rel-A system
MWRLGKLTSLHWRRWDDEWVVFDVASGQTHRLDLFTAVTLLTLEEAPRDRVGLAAALAADLELESNDALAAALDTALQRLQTVGLVESLT